MITAAPRRVFVYEPDALVPKRLMPRETRAMLKGMRDAVELVILTSHAQGSDLILRTLEYLGDRSTLSVPRPPVPPESDPKGSPSACSCVVHGSLLLSPRLSLKRRSRCAVLWCPVVVSRRAGGRAPSLRRSYSPSVRAASNAPKPFGVQARAALRTAERIHSSRRKRLPTALLVRGVVEAAAGVEDALEPCVLALLQVKRYRDGVKQGFGSRQPLFVRPLSRCGVHVAQPV